MSQSTLAMAPPGSASSRCPRAQREQLWEPVAAYFPSSQRLQLTEPGAVLKVSSAQGAQLSCQ
jgi:hypothetical protein